MPIGRGSRSASLGLLVAGLAASVSARAGDIYSGLQTPHADWSAFTEVSHTDNATLQPGGPSDSIATAGLDASVYRDTGRLRANIDASTEYENYLDNTYASHVLGQLRGLVSYAFVPEQFIWAVQDTYGQLNENPLLPSTPQNRTNANVVSTGPDLSVHFAADTALQVGARYEQSNFQGSGNALNDDRRLSGNLGLVENLSQATALSLNVNAARIEYPNSVQPGYDQEELYGRYETRDPRTGLAVDGGVSEIREAGSTEHAPLLRLTFFRRLTPFWNLNLSAGSEFQNTANALQAALNGTQVVSGQVVAVPTGPVTGPGAGTADVILTQSAFRADTARIALDFVRLRTSFDINGSLEHDRYGFGASDLDRDIYSGGASFSRRLQPSLTLLLSASYQRRQPLGPAAADRTEYGDAALDWRAGAKLVVTLAYHHEVRTTDLGGFGYRENFAYLRLAYGSPKRLIASPAPGQQALGVPSAQP